MNKLEEELMASERLSKVFKDASDDAEKHLKELREDYDARGGLLEESKSGWHCKFP